MTELLIVALLLIAGAIVLLAAKEVCKIIGNIIDTTFSVVIFGILIALPFVIIKIAS